MIGIACAAVAAVLGIVVWKIFSGRAGEPYPYKKRRSLFTESEMFFLRTLEQAAGEEYRVCTKVRVADALCVRPLANRKQWLGAWERIRCRHFDFLLCDPESHAPMAAVELDDGSGDNPRRSVRDGFLENACLAAGLSLVRISEENRDSVHEVRQRILEGLHELHPGQPENGACCEESPGADDTPVCPKCSSVMVRRRINKGPRTGRMYWSCSRFPRCMGALPIQTDS